MRCGLGGGQTAAGIRSITEFKPLGGLALVPSLPFATPRSTAMRLGDQLSITKSLADGQHTYNYPDEARGRADHLVPVRARHNHCKTVHPAGMPAGCLDLLGSLV